MKVKHIGQNSSFDCTNQQIGENVEIGDGVSIRCDNLKIGDNVTIAGNVSIVGQNICIGSHVVIEERVNITRKGSTVKLGDGVIVGNDCKFTAPIMIFGDYCTINNHCMISGNQPFILGHNAWIGQNCVLNSQQSLTIGNNFGLGMYSCIYTHGYFGELLEGCTIFKEEKVQIGNDVWILGQFNMISPGVTIHDKGLILNGSNVTRDINYNSTVGGNPARDLSDKLVPYTKVTLSEKYQLMKKFIGEWLTTNYPGRWRENDNVITINTLGDIVITDKEYQLKETTRLICATDKKLIKGASNTVPIFDLKAKTYNKTLSEIEIDFIRFMKSYRARFVPENEPVVADQ